MTVRKIATKLLILLVFLVMVNFIEALCFGGAWLVLDLKARKSIAEKLDIEADWSSFESYIQTSFEPGMSRKEVLKRAETISPFVINPFFIGDEYCEAFYFTVGPFRTSRGGRWDICYNENDVVIHIELYRSQ
jgi:hypothetical protein